MKRSWIVIGVIVLLGLAGIVALRLYSRQAEHEAKSQLYIPKTTHITAEIDLLQQYVRIDTSNPPGRELAGARFLAALLEKNGVRAEVIESAPGRGNVYARLKGRLPDQGLLLLNHIDVVPAARQGWTHPPFEAAIALNQLWGRGSLDMKSVGICELEAFLAVAGSRRPPERDVVFLAVADEEAGGVMGTQWLLQHRPDIFQGVRYAVNEGGVTETRAERIVYFGVEIGTKMSVRVRLRGASREQMQRVRIALEPFFGPPDPDRVLPEVRMFLRQLAPQRMQQRPYLENVDKTIAAGKFWLLSRPYKELTQNVVWAGGVRSEGTDAVMDVNLYDLPDEDPDRRLQWLRSKIAPYGVEVEAVLEKNGPTPLSSPQTPFFDLIRKNIAQQYGSIAVGVEILAAASNDSRFLRARGIVCYGLWPFPVDYYQSLGIHGLNERIRLDWFMQGVALMRRLVQEYAAG